MNYLSQCAELPAGFKQAIGLSFPLNSQLTASSYSTSLGNVFNPLGGSHTQNMGGNLLQESPEPALCLRNSHSLENRLEGNDKNQGNEEVFMM